MTSDELHIASLVVHVAPRRLERVASQVAALPGAEVHASAANGKLVVTIEASSGDEMSRKTSTIGRIDGVLSTALVYQCADTLEAMNEEIDDAQARVR